MDSYSRKPFWHEWRTCDGQPVFVCASTHQYLPDEHVIEAISDVPGEAYKEYPLGDETRIRLNCPQVHVQIMTGGSRSDNNKTLYVKPHARLIAHTKIQSGRRYSTEVTDVHLFDAGIIEPTGMTKQFLITEPDEIPCIDRKITENEAWAALEHLQPHLDKGVQRAITYRTEIDNDTERIRKAKEQIPNKTSRDEFEQIANEIGAEIRSDEELQEMSYGMKYGEFSLPHYNADQIIRWTLWRSRWRQIEEDLKPERERKAKEARAAYQREQAKKPRCSYDGCNRPGTMNASLGLACPQHYDALSAI